MPWLDARLPIRFGSLGSREPGEAVLTDDAGLADPPAASFTPEAGPETRHGPGCACCLPRTAAAGALAALFRQRALAAGPAFRAILAVVGPAGERAVREAVSSDPVVSARFRLGG